MGRATAAVAATYNAAAGCAVAVELKGVQGQQRGGIVLTSVWVGAPAAAMHSKKQGKHHRCEAL
jgi:hypothetical protein